MGSFHSGLFARAAAFILLNDSKFPFAIEG